MQKRFDRPLILVIAVLLVLGMVMVQSASGPVATDRMGDPWFYVKRQGMALAPGLIGCVVLAWLPYDTLRKYAWAAYAAVIVGLLLVFVPGLGNRVNGASRWIGIGSINLQPSEFAKLASMLCMAHFIDLKKGRLDDIKGVLLPALLIPAPLMALILLEPDFGTTAIVGGMACVTLYVAGLRSRYLYAVAGMAVAGAIPAVIFASYRLKRVAAVLDPWADAQGSGYQLIQSMIAYNSGGLTGLGLGESQAKHLFLPEPWTDFISSVLAEEMGLMGVLFLLSLYGLLVWRGLTIAHRASDLFGMLLASTVTAAIGLQAFFNLGVAMGIVPPKGLVLPFMSYGASAIIGHLICVGLLLNISANADRKPHRPTIYRPAVILEGA
ncbi:MAG: putative lipid II flippase FtsW [Alphaproteobacteria bacterium]|nr:putative lipid II flippase FtsW [Alphaproteobacteria bacterium]